MGKKKPDIIKISVRNLVEFIFREGDLNSLGSGVRDTEAMQQGSRIHRKIQRRMGPNYEAEVSLFAEQILKSGDDTFCLKVEGRADGILREEGTIVDEIKGVYFDLSVLKEPVFVHKAQAMCYAYMIALEDDLEEVGVQVTYCHLESEVERKFQEFFTFAEIEGWFFDLIEKYSKWAMYEYQWKKIRNDSIKKIEFPFPYRAGQKDLAVGVYRTIQREKKLYLEAPTGVGKTVSTVFPAIKAMGEGLTNRLFYLTAKTITRTVAEECFQLLQEQNLKFKPITLTAKEKVCILDKISCNPSDCVRAKGHFDRVNEAVYDLLIHEDKIDRELISAYAEKHNVCPFEMSLDASLFSDAVICDYNYVFDPNIYLKRFFGGEKKGDMVFLIDEAHNLVERGREMYSAILYKDDFLKVKRVVKKMADSEYSAQAKRELVSFSKALESANRALLTWKHECDEFTEIESLEVFQFAILRVMAEFENFLKNHSALPERDMILDFFFSVRHFSNIMEIMNEKYTTYTDYDEAGQFRVKLQCMDPSDNLKLALSRGKSAVFFSATLLPIRYYKEQLAGEQDDYAVYAESSFAEEQRRIFIARDVSSKYTRRNQTEYEKIANYLLEFTNAKQGNYLVFFPSYLYMENIKTIFEKKSSAQILVQEKSMSELEREDFLGAFAEGNTQNQVGFCVMGGIFSEGIDLKNDRLIGAAIVGTGLPMVCNERELFRRYYEERSGNGFEYAYLYQGMNKVLQSGGRVIRTVEDKGVILLLDERFQLEQYRNLFPREWYPYEVVTLETMKQSLTDFWS